MLFFFLSIVPVRACCLRYESFALATRYRAAVLSVNVHECIMRSMPSKYPFDWSRLTSDVVWCGSVHEPLMTRHGFILLFSVLSNHRCAGLEDAHGVISWADSVRVAAVRVYFIGWLLRVVASDISTPV